MGNLFSTISDDQRLPNSLVVHIPSLRRGENSNESERLRAEIARLVASIRSRTHDVNIVFTGPICIGAAQFCSQFAGPLTNYAFRYVDDTAILASSNNSPGVSRWRECFTRIQERRHRALEAFIATKPDQRHALSLHTADLVRESLLYKLLVDAERDERVRALVPPTPAQPNPTAQSASGPRLRVFFQNASDFAVAAARASQQLGYLRPHELEALELDGELAWIEASRVRSASDTLYVYLSYDDLTYAQAYEACLVENRRSRANAAALMALEQLQQHARITKRCLDELYTSPQNDIVAKYFSVVMQFNGRDLLSPLHQLVVAREVLSYVHSLEVGHLWGNSNDAHRIRYLGSTDWIPMRVRTIPSIISVSTTPKEDIRREFSTRQPPLPRATSCSSLPTATVESPIVNRRVEELRSRSASMIAASPSPAAVEETRRVYGAGNTFPRAKSERPALVIENNE